MDEFDFQQLADAKRAHTARNGVFHDSLTAATDILEHELANTEPHLLASSERQGLRTLDAELHGRLVRSGEARHAVDGGKTFTDLAASQEQRRMAVEERPSVPAREAPPRGEW